MMDFKSIMLSAISQTKKFKYHKSHLYVEYKDICVCVCVCVKIDWWLPEMAGGWGK